MAKRSDLKDLTMDDDLPSSTSRMNAEMVARLARQKAPISAELDMPCKCGRIGCWDKKNHGDWDVDERSWGTYKVRLRLWSDWCGSAYRFARGPSGFIKRFWTRAAAQAYADDLNNRKVINTW